MKFFITKYALTKGILEMTGEVVREKSVDELGRMGRSVVECVGQFSHRYYHGDDWHQTREEALVRVEKMRLQKIAAMEKKLEKLRNLKVQ
jgi:hypothetical protein